MDMNQLIELQQSATFLGSIGGLALALLGAGLAAAPPREPASPVRRAPACCVRTPASLVRS